MSITRDQVEANSYLWPDGTVAYQQWGTNSPTKDRPDCSGYVGGCCWGIKVPSINTVTLVTDGWMFEIPFADRRKGDAFGRCGEGTAGDAGHIQLYLWDTATGLFIAEQSGGPPGPRHHTIKGLPAGYKTYRFKDITDGPNGDSDVPKIFRVNEDGLTGLTSGTTWYYLDSHEAVESAKRFWGIEVTPIAQSELSAMGTRVPWGGGGGGDLPDHKHHGAAETGGVVA